MNRQDPDALLADLIRRYPELDVCQQDIRSAFETLERVYRREGKLLVCGSGGSAADSEHIVGELMKGFKLKRPVPEEVRKRLEHHFPGEADYLASHLQRALPAISLVSQTALLTAFANDVAVDMMFAQQVYGYGRPGDALLALSTSGNSASALNALRVARALGLATLGLSGRSGGKMKALCDVAICVPFDETLEIQERHLPVYHTICLMLEQAFFGG